MKRVLLIAYCFPPDPVPGAQRPGYVARYLPQFGWEATVLTHTRAEPPFPVRAVRVRAPATAIGVSRTAVRKTRFAALRPALRRVKEIVAFPDDEALWIPPAVLRSVRLLRSERYDAVLSTALPVSSHIVGACASALTGTPWIADYRDPWSGNRYMSWGPVKRHLHKALELAVMRAASQITTVSDQLAEDFRRLHGPKVTAIENAFDPLEWSDIPDETPTGFDLVYTGTMYGGKRSAGLLFRALANLRDRQDPLASAAHVHFYGPNNEIAYEEAKRYGLESQVTIHGTLPRAAAMAAQRRAAALLIFLSMERANAHEKGSKYLEYLGAKRRILVFGPAESALRGAISELRAGYFAADTAQTEEALRILYTAYRSGQHRVTINTAAVDTAEQLAGRFADVLNSVVVRPARLVPPCRPAVEHSTK